MKRVLGVLLIAACGKPAATAVELPTTPSASAAIVSPHVANACSAWGSCRASGAPVRVSEARIGQSPNVVFDGSDALVTYDTPSEGSRVAAIDMRGRLLWSEPIAGSYPQIAWNPRSRSGLVVTSETIVWLGRDGRPGPRTSLPRMQNVTFHGAVAAQGDGFLVASGVGAHASNAQPMALSVAKIGAPADAIVWRKIDDDGLRHPPVLAPPDGAAWLVSQAFTRPAELFSVSPPESTTTGPALRLPNAPSARAVAAGEHHELVFVLFVDDVTHAVSVATTHGERQTPQIDIGVISKRSNSVVVFRLGEQLVVGADKIGDSPGVAIAPFEIEPTPHVGAPLAIGPENSQHLRVAPTDRGFVAVWNIADDAAPLIPLANHAPMHGLSTMIAIYTCCPTPPP